MLTIGIDLAYQDKETALCAIDWSMGPQPIVLEVRKGVSNDVIVEWGRRAACLAIDAPMGWPNDFVEFVTAHSQGRQVGSPETDYDSLWFRLTDQRMPKHPLSVAGDKLAKPAARCAHLQTLLPTAGVKMDRSGETGQVIEVYPAAALKIWGFTKSYKNASGSEQRAKRKAAREEIASHLARHARLVDRNGDSGPVVEGIAETDDHLDACVCALLARAKSVGQITNAPAGGDRERARIEGWIYLPTRDALDHLT